MVDYENVIFSNLGQFGRFQGIIMGVCKAGDFVASWVMMMTAVIGGSDQWWTKGTLYNNVTNQTEPYKRYTTCPTGKGETIVFSSEVSTIVSEFGLVCSKDWVPNTITTIQMAGVIVGAFIIAHLGDLIGRKKSFYIPFGLMMISTFASAFSRSWEMFAVFRFFCGVTLGGHLIVAYTFPMEYVGTKWRTIGAGFPAWAIGVAVLGLVSSAVKDWRHLCMITGGMGFPVLLTWWFVPDSCRWLLSKGRIEEANKVLERMAKMNKREVPDLSKLRDAISEEILEKKKRKRYTFVDLFTRWSALKPLLLCGFMFFSATLGYYGFTLGVSELSGDKHFNLFLSGLAETLAIVMVIFLSIVLKRRKTTISLFLMGSICSVGIAAAYFLAKRELFDKVQNVLAFGAKFFLSGGFTSLYLLVAEVFPTVVRNLGVGAVSTTGRVGGLLSPQLLYLHKVNIAIPYAVCGVLLGISGIICFFIHETYEEPLPDEFEEKWIREFEIGNTLETSKINESVDP